MSMTVLVTGGSGYVASHALVRLLEEGYDVRTTVRDLDRAPGLEAAVAGLVDPAGRLSFHAAELLSDDGWSEALEGVDFVLHIASPLGGAHGDEALLRPARDGALRVLRYSRDAGVRRVVMTSAAVASQPPDTRKAAVTDETLWTDPEGRRLSAYQRSKVLAEKAAWDFVSQHPGDTELTTVLPGAVFGPVVGPGSRGSTDIIERMLLGAMPGLPDIRLEIVDVRDLVDLHVRAMTNPVAAGQRFIGVTGGLTPMVEIADILRRGLGTAAAKVPTRKIPNLAVRGAALFQEDMRTLASALGRRHRHDNTLARQLLGWSPRPVEATILDCANSLIGHRVVP